MQDKNTKRQKNKKDKKAKRQKGIIDILQHFKQSTKKKMFLQVENKKYLKSQNVLTGCMALNNSGRANTKNISPFNGVISYFGLLKTEFPFWSFLNKNLVETFDSFHTA